MFNRASVLRPGLTGTAAVLLVCLLPRLAKAQSSRARQSTTARQVEAERRIEALRAQIETDEARMRQQAEETERLRSELSELRRALAEEQNRRAAERAQDREAAERDREVLSRSIADRPAVGGKLGLTLSGFVHADATWRQSSEDQLNNATGDPLNETRFLIRRARLRASLEYERVSGALELDGNTVRGPTARLIAAEASYQLLKSGHHVQPLLLTTLGMFKTPFGFEVVQSDRDRLFIDRSTIVRALFPGEYDVGARLQGGWRFLTYSLAVMNGHPIGERQFPGRDPTAAKDFLGRVGIDTQLVEGVGLQMGASGLYGTGLHKGTPSTKDVLVWRDTDEDNVVQLPEIQVIPGQPATPSQSFSRGAIGGDVRLHLRTPRLGALMLYGELMVARNLDRSVLTADPVSAGRDLREIGWYLAAAQEVGRHAMIGVRYDRYNPDRDSSENRGGIAVPRDNTFTTLAVAGALRLPGYGRLIAEYDHNTNALGRDINGAPTTLKDDAVTLRAEVTF